MKWVIGEDAQAPLGRGPLEAAGHRAERVDVEAGVDLVEDAERRPEHAELEHLVALALAAGEVDVERAVEEPRVEADRASASSAMRSPSERRLASASVARPGGRRQERVASPTPGHLDRVLQGEEQPGPGPLPGRQARQLLPVEARSSPRSPRSRVGPSARGPACSCPSRSGP